MGGNSSKNISARVTLAFLAVHTRGKTRANVFTIYYWSLANQASKDLMSQQVYEVSDCVIVWDEKLHSGNPLECP